MLAMASPEFVLPFGPTLFESVSTPSPVAEEDASFLRPGKRGRTSYPPAKLSKKRGRDDDDADSDQLDYYPSLKHGTPDISELIQADYDGELTARDFPLFDRLIHASIPEELALIYRDMPIIAVDVSIESELELSPANVFVQSGRPGEPLATMRLNQFRAYAPLFTSVLSGRRESEKGWKLVKVLDDDENYNLTVAPFSAGASRRILMHGKPVIHPDVETFVPNLTDDGLRTVEQILPPPNGLFPSVDNPFILDISFAASSIGRPAATLPGRTTAGAFMGVGRRLSDISVSRFHIRVPLRKIKGVDVAYHAWTSVWSKPCPF